MYQQLHPGWYAIRVTYSRELKAKELLDELGVESFIPMRHTEKIVGAKRVRVLAPVIHNLVFIKSTKNKLDQIKQRIPYLRYIMDRHTNRPVVVPTKQMESFIVVAGTLDEQLRYIEAPDHALQRGDRVRITAGTLQGVEGIYLRIKGDRRVVVAIEGFLAVATAFVHPSLLEHIEKE